MVPASVNETSKQRVYAGVFDPKGGMPNDDTFSFPVLSTMTRPKIELRRSCQDVAVSLNTYFWLTLVAIRFVLVECLV